MARTRTDNARRDLIGSIACLGATLLVGALLLHRIINGNWESVAFVAITFAVAFAFHLRFVPLANSQRAFQTDKPNSDVLSLN